MWEPTAQLNDLLRHLGCGRVRAMCRRMRPIHEPVRFTKLTSPTPFVECVPANSVAPAQFRHAPVPRVVISHHPNALFHPTGLRKWHRRVLPPMHVDLSTILPVQSVGDLPSLYPELVGMPPHPICFASQVLRSQIDPGSSPGQALSPRAGRGGVC